MVIEDLHWIDSGSEELLSRIVDSESPLRLLLVHTPPPEYAPPWLEHPIVTKLHLEPLSVGDIRRLIQTRFSGKRSSPKRSCVKSQAKPRVIRYLLKRSSAFSPSAACSTPMRARWNTTATQWRRRSRKPAGCLNRSR